MIVLGVETSCDETAVAIVEDGKKVLADVVFSQIDIHKLYGGVVPEIASRKHIAKIISVFDEAFKEAGIKASDIDLVAVTTHPGLIGSLLVGINAAYAFSLANNIECIGVDHINGHIYANYVESDFSFPTLALVVSGGHTELVLMRKHYDFEVLGETFDDAVGEAYDKVARVMGLTYPGGAKVDNLAINYQGHNSYHLPIYDSDDYNFSFSGVKSAVLNLVNKCKMKGEDVDIPALANAFQDSVTKVLVDKTIKAAKEYNVKQIIVAGGVAANKGLRERLAKEVSKLNNVSLTFPKFRYCTDNAVMIATAGYFQKLTGENK